MSVDPPNPDNREQAKNLQLASSYVNDSWFPVNAAVLDSIQDRLYRGSYDQDRTQLISDLKQDTSLYLYCLRRLSEMLPQEDTNGPRKISPTQLFNGATLSQFREALAVQAHVVSTHHPDEAAEEQLDCSAIAVMSATTAGELASSYQVEGEDAYSCALLRQLGLTLVAWNYPHVYRRITSTLRPGENLDESLHKMLGFSPRILALSLARRWHLSDTILRGIDPEASITEAETEETMRVSRALREICRVSEIFAHALRNEAAPRTMDWADALREITARLGPNAVEHLKGAIRKNLRDFAERYPGLLPPTAGASAAPPLSEAQPVARATHIDLPRLFENNLYIKRCNESEQGAFKSLYDACKDGVPGKDALDVLHDKVIPALGFERGCIYLLEPESMNLMPRLALGSASLLDFEPVRFSSSLAVFDPIVAAFSSKTPSIEEKEIAGRGRVMYIACSLGEFQRTGVLYLELGEGQIVNRRSTNPLVAFKAVRQALVDILSLT